MTDQLKAKCKNCGGDSFEWPSSETEPTDDDIVTCIGCGAKSKMLDIKSQMMKAAKKMVQDRLRKLVDDFNKK